MDRFALILVIISAIAWGIVRIFGYIVSGSMTYLARIIYILFALGGLWCIKFLFRERTVKEHRNT